MYAVNCKGTAAGVTIKTTSRSCGETRSAPAPRPAPGPRTKININNNTHPYLKHYDTLLNRNNINAQTNPPQKQSNVTNAKLRLPPSAQTDDRKKNRSSSEQQLKNISSLSTIQWHQLSLRFWALLLNLLLKELYIKLVEIEQGLSR